MVLGALDTNDLQPKRSNYEDYNTFRKADKAWNERERGRRKRAKATAEFSGEQAIAVEERATAAEERATAAEKRAAAAEERAAAAEERVAKAAAMANAVVMADVVVAKQAPRLRLSNAERELAEQDAAQRKLDCIELLCRCAELEGLTDEEADEQNELEAEAILATTTLGVNRAMQRLYAFWEKHEESQCQRTQEEEVCPIHVASMPLPLRLAWLKERFARVSEVELKALLRTNNGNAALVARLLSSRARY